MHLKGLDELRKKLPGYPGKKILMVPLKGVITFILSYFFILSLDTLPRLFVNGGILATIEPLTPILGSILVAAIAYVQIGEMWTKRDAMKEEYGPLAYQRMITSGVRGVFLIPTLIFHAATPISLLPPAEPTNDLAILLSQSLLSLVSVPSWVDIILRVSICGVFCLLGMLSIRSALLTFGVDYMAVAYLYFPEESSIQQDEIYSVMRHPTYFSVILLAVAALALQFSIYSITISMIASFLIRLHIRREELELVDRFGGEYREYIDSVPALHVRVDDIPAFLRYLRGPKHMES